MTLVTKPAAPKMVNDATELVGNTPLVRLNKISKDLPANIAAKVEYFNPTCSVKDRAGLNMITQAEKRGILIPGKSVLIECTSGNTGISMAQVAAVRGYKTVLIMPETASLERRAMMRAFGADLILLDKSLGVTDGIERAYALAAQIPNAVVLNQFINEDNPLMHYCTTGPEIWQQTEGKVAAVVFGIGTGGTMTGAGRFLKEQNSAIKVYSAEPFESSVINGLPKGKHTIQGIGAGLVPDVYDQSIVEKCLRVKSEDATAMALRLAREEGLMVGLSSGANVCAAVQLSSLPEFKDKLIVTSFADFGERYLSTILYKNILDEVSAQGPTSFEQDLALLTEKFGAKC